MTEKRVQPYVSRKLSKALEWLGSRSSRYEGLYSAYEESLQWLEDLDDLPIPVSQVLKEFRGGAAPLPVEVRVRHVRNRIAAMTEADVCALAERLETAKQSLLWQPANVA